MSEAACAKAAICTGGCLDSIVVDNFRELTAATVTVIANGLLEPDQVEDIIDLYTDYEKEVKRRRKADREARGKLKAILDL